MFCDFLLGREFLYSKNRINTIKQIDGSHFEINVPLFPYYFDICKNVERVLNDPGVKESIIINMTITIR